jgi:hypothetical protein
MVSSGILVKGKIWKILVDAKYNTYNPNIFAYREAGSSNF